MLQIGIRLHDVNAELSQAEQTLEARAKKAREEGFSCVHLALSKCVAGVSFDDAALTEGLAAHVRRVFGQNGLDVAVLGCYLNLAHPDEGKLREFQSRYFAHLRLAAACGAGMVGTETGAPNAAYKLDENTHTDAALHTFLRSLEPVVECAEHWGVTLAIEPVWNHIVYSADRALEAIRSIGSRNLRVIFDPVNLLGMDNSDDRSRVIGEAAEKLCDHIAMVHIKDFVRRDGRLVSVAAGTGEMDYTELCRFMKARKPYIQATLENTSNANAVAAKELIERVYESV
ncbi:MAG: sugar phosphate isomerase/epimerase [Oscillospiraceae bacterium]|nr:sugar phosphate isomerase/epimerase [Oscillospiraceae bacterium]